MGKSVGGENRQTDLSLWVQLSNCLAQSSSGVIHGPLPISPPFTPLFQQQIAVTMIVGFPAILLRQLVQIKPTNDRVNHKSHTCTCWFVDELPIDSNASVVVAANRWAVDLLWPLKEEQYEEHLRREHLSEEQISISISISSYQTLNVALLRGHCNNWEHN